MASLIVLLGITTSSPALAQQESPLEPLDTSSPRATFVSFVDQVSLLEDLLLAYERDRTEANQAAFSSALTRTRDLFDLSEVPSANRGEVYGLAFASLADIVNRLPRPDLEEFPDEEDLGVVPGEITVPDEDEPLVDPDGIGVPGAEDQPDEEATEPLTGFTVPGTEIQIVRLEEGPRRGAFVFSAETVDALPGYRDQVEGLPVNDGVRVRDWVEVQLDFTGHLLPTSFVDALPDTFDREFLGSLLWKSIADVLVLALVGVIGWLWYRWVGRRGTPGTPLASLLRLTTPVVVLVATGLARRFMDEQINHSGDLAIVMNTVITAVVWATFAWAFWLATGLVVEWIIATPRIRDDSIDAHLLRMVGKVVSVVGVFAFSLAGLARIGISAIGLGIGAGVFGLAVGLAATTTLENLLGGITLYADKPFRVGDVIAVDDDRGTVENIGPRSTRIRLFDHTQVTVPNADISRAKITNFSRRRQMLFKHVIGVRYETTIEQLRTIVDQLDVALRARPMVLDEEDFPRVTVIGFGASSVDIEIRAHVPTDDIATFARAQQELLLVIHEVVERCGSSFAFPSTTAYLTDDAGLPEPEDAELESVSSDPSTDGP